MFKRIDHIEIISANAIRSVEFYINVLGFKLKQTLFVSCPPLRKLHYLQLGDTMIEILDARNLSPANGDEWRVGYRGMALEVDDMDEALASLREAGVEPVWGPTDLGDSIRAEIKDPDGLTIELREWRWKTGERDELITQEKDSNN